MVSHRNTFGALKVIDCFKTAEKPHDKCYFMAVENNPAKSLYKSFNFKQINDLKYVHFPHKNKSAALNFAIGSQIKTESLIIFVDDDIEFEKDYILKYYNNAIAKGTKFYFGGSFNTVIPVTYKKELIPFLNASAQGKNDLQFLNMKNLMFLGFSFTVFYSQWSAVNGFDERFGPGSHYGMGGQESVFQKKLMVRDFIPYFVENNSVKHNPAYHTLSADRIALRQESNGKSHGFQGLIISKDSLKSEYFKKLIYFCRRLINHCFQKDELTFRMKSSYTKGYFKALWIYFRANDKKSYLDF